jgi:hypothetical protein
MTPNITNEQWQGRQLYNPTPGSVTATILVYMFHRKKRHLSDWVLGCLKLGIQRGEITKKQADIFQSVFVEHAKIRQSPRRQNAGHAFTGPGGEIMQIERSDKWISMPGSGGVPRNSTFLRLDGNLKNHPGYEAWIEEFFTGQMDGEDDSGVEDSADEAPHTDKRGIERAERIRKAQEAMNMEQGRDSGLDSSDVEIGFDMEGEHEEESEGSAHEGSIDQGVRSSARNMQAVGTRTESIHSPATFHSHVKRERVGEDDESEFGYSADDTPSHSQSSRMATDSRVTREGEKKRRVESPPSSVEVCVKVEEDVPSFGTLEINPITSRRSLIRRSTQAKAEVTDLLGLTVCILAPCVPPVLIVCRLMPSSWKSLLKLWSTLTMLRTLLCVTPVLLWSVSDKISIEHNQVYLMS